MITIVIVIILNQHQNHALNLNGLLYSIRIVSDARKSNANIRRFFAKWYCTLLPAEKSDFDKTFYKY